MKEIIKYTLLLILFTFLGEIVDGIRLGLFGYDDIGTNHILVLILLYHTFINK